MRDPLPLELRPALPGGRVAVRRTDPDARPRNTRCAGGDRPLRRLRGARARGSPSKSTSSSCTPGPETAARWPCSATRRATRGSSCGSRRPSSPASRSGRTPADSAKDTSPAWSRRRTTPTPGRSRRPATASCPSPTGGRYVAETTLEILDTAGGGRRRGGGRGLAGPGGAGPQEARRAVRGGGLMPRDSAGPEALDEPPARDACSAIRSATGFPCRSWSRRTGAPR